MNNDDRCRFEALIQSFDILSADQFKGAKEMKEIILKDPSYTLTEMIVADS